jgi:glucokinase
LELGTWNLELGTWNLELGTWNLETVALSRIQELFYTYVSAARLGFWNYDRQRCTDHMSEISGSEGDNEPLFLGVDVGGTGIKIGLVDNRGRPIAKARIDTLEARGPEDAIRRVHQAARALLAEQQLSYGQLRAIGLGTPGTMDIPGGMILSPPNLPHWRSFPIRDALSAECERPVAFTNDANAAAYGEYWVGSGQSHKSMIMLTLGTGVGGGVIVDGKCIEGSNSFGSECGHILVDSRDDARKCVWGGGQGQLEAYASASAVARRMHELLRAGEESQLLNLGREIETLTPLELAEAGDDGDPLALRIIAEAGTYLGVGIVTLVHTIDPGIVVLGGAMNFGGAERPAGRHFLESIQTEFRRRAFDVVRDTTQLAFATLGSDAGYIGAAGYARDYYRT